MRRPVRVGLVVVGVRPEGEAVLDGVPGMQRAGVRPAPDPGGEDAPAGIAGEDRGKAVNELRGGIVRLRQAVLVLRQERHRRVLQVVRDLVQVQDLIIPGAGRNGALFQKQMGISPRQVDIPVQGLDGIRLGLGQRRRLDAVDRLVAQGEGRSRIAKVLYCFSFRHLSAFANASCASSLSFSQSLPIFSNRSA